MPLDGCLEVKKLAEQRADNFLTQTPDKRKAYLRFVIRSYEGALQLCRGKDILEGVIRGKLEEFKRLEQISAADPANFDKVVELFGLISRGRSETITTQALVPDRALSAVGQSSGAQ